jgi:hypothetical protein
MKDYITNYSKMNKEKINQTIAEACGWSFPHDDIPIDPDGYAGVPPDYTTDLNAIYNAIKIIDERNPNRFQSMDFKFSCALGEMFADYTDMFGPGDDGYFDAINASPQDRAKALYICVNKMIDKNKKSS